MNKTLIGKNDSCKELELHNNNLCIVDSQFYKRYESV